MSVSPNQFYGMHQPKRFPWIEELAALEKELADAIWCAPAKKKKRKRTATLLSPSATATALAAGAPGTAVTSATTGRRKSKDSRTTSSTAASRSITRLTAPNTSRGLTKKKKWAVHGVVEPDGSIWEDASSILGNFDNYGATAGDDSDDSSDNEDVDSDDDDNDDPPIASASNGKQRGIPKVHPFLLSQIFY
ncbi:hypothetical protein DXG03_008801 [Asterophora parasitica]|uniref:Uncharacterized protein n=1 Tax=Asterophora parasitica TaxID=117018 RepID=A0A9P7KB88_9AGAR|nr:hypothetical protein DXG03_008801 [Asterophora parasitica]